MTELIDQVEAWTRQAVPDVFRSMVSLELTPEPALPLQLDEGGQIIGSVGFAGQATGIIYLYTGLSFAKVITGRMLGIEETEVDSGEMVNDAIGELSNMVVGNVKSRLCDTGLNCTLTIPSVVRGQHLSVEGASKIAKRMIGFRNGEHLMVAELLIKVA